MHITFDTLEMVRRFEAKGIKREQAEEISVVKDVQNELATKEDLKNLEKNLELHLTLKLSGIMFSMLLAFKIFDKFI